MLCHVKFSQLRCPSQNCHFLNHFLLQSDDLQPAGLQGHLDPTFSRFRCPSQNGHFLINFLLQSDDLQPASLQKHMDLKFSRFRLQRPITEGDLPPRMEES